MKTSLLDLDKTSEYFRICPYCHYQFMASHMSRVFCSDKCGDDFNNSKKRHNYQTLYHTNTDERVDLTNRFSPIQNFELKIKENLKILDQFTIDPDHGSYFNFEYLENLGFDFNYYSGRQKILDTPDKFKIQIGKYQISRPTFETTLIETLILQP